MVEFILRNALRNPSILFVLVLVLVFVLLFAARRTVLVPKERLLPEASVQHHPIHE